MAQEMDSIYENYSFIRATLASENTTEWKESKRKRKRPKWTKVLLIGLMVSLFFSLGGLVALGILYFNVSVKLSDQETNGTMMARELDELKVNHTRVTDDLRTNEIEAGECTANYNRVEEQLSSCEANYNRVKKRLSSCEAFKAKPLRCDVYLAAFPGKLYFFSCDKRTWSSSQAFCVSRGGNLVTINSQEEQRFLHSKASAWYWIGLNDLETEGRWVWANGQTLQETGVQFWHQRPFGESEPDNWKEMDPSGEHCALVRNDFTPWSNSWSDFSCKGELNFICEKKY